MRTNRVNRIFIIIVAVMVLVILPKISSNKKADEVKETSQDNREITLTESNVKVDVAGQIEEKQDFKNLQTDKEESTKLSTVISLKQKNTHPEIKDDINYYKVKINNGNFRVLTNTFAHKQDGKYVMFQDQEFPEGFSVSKLLVLSDKYKISKYVVTGNILVKYRDDKKTIDLPIAYNIEHLNITVYTIQEGMDIFNVYEEIKKNKNVESVELELASDEMRPL